MYERPGFVEICVAFKRQDLLEVRVIEPQGFGMFVCTVVHVRKRLHKSVCCHRELYWHLPC